jgi:hypothetical protein
MFHRWAALVLVLALCAMSPKNAAGQSTQSPRGHGAVGKLGHNYPNPFNPDTYLPFTVGDANCAPGSEQHVVSLQLVNVLAQPVVVPVLFGAPSSSMTSFPSAFKGQPVHNMTLGCGSYVAYWDGKIAKSGREAASGTYGVLLMVDGRLQDTFKIFYKK